MGGGPSQQQKDAAAAQANASNQASQNSAANEKLVLGNFKLVNPFATSRLNNGLPFYNNLTDASSGATAQAFAPGRAALLRNLSGYGDLPSGFRTSQLANYNEGQARAFDNSLTQNMFANEQAKQQAAQLLTGQASNLNPIGWNANAINANNSIMNAPLQQSNPLMGILGGAVEGASTKIPF